MNQNNFPLINAQTDPIGLGWYYPVQLQQDYSENNHDLLIKVFESQSRIFENQSKILEGQMILKKQQEEILYRIKRVENASLGKGIALENGWFAKNFKAVGFRCNSNAVTEVFGELFELPLIVKPNNQGVQFKIKCINEEIFQLYRHEDILQTIGKNVVAFPKKIPRKDLTFEQAKQEELISKGPPIQMNGVSVEISSDGFIHISLKYKTDLPSSLKNRVFVDFGLTTGAPFENSLLILKDALVLGKKLLGKKDEMMKASLLYLKNMEKTCDLSSTWWYERFKSLCAARSQVKWHPYQVKNNVIVLDEIEDEKKSPVKEKLPPIFDLDEQGPLLNEEYFAAPMQLLGFSDNKEKDNLVSFFQVLDKPLDAQTGKNA